MPDSITAWPAHAFTIASYNFTAKSTHWTYQSGLTAYLSFCSSFDISPIPATILTPQYFYADTSQYVSYKSLKIYLAFICLMHIEEDLADPTTDESLHSVCQRICRQQDAPEWKRLPITCFEDTEIPVMPPTSQH